MSKLLESGDLQHHIYKNLQPTYARRFQILLSAMQRHLVPLGVTLPQTHRDVMGGYFVWLSLPSPLKADNLALRAREEENVIIASGPLFGVFGDTAVVDLDAKVRICFSWEEEDRLVEGVERLERVIRQMLMEVRNDQGDGAKSAIHPDIEIVDSCR